MGTEKTMICNIFGGADISDYSSVNVEDGLIVAADRGYIHCQMLGIADKVDILIGDFDSLADIPENVKIHRSPCRKNDTDMMLAVKWGFEQGCTEFRIYGGLGGRAGHTAGNVQSLRYIHSHGGHGVLFGDKCDMELLDVGSKEYSNSDGKIQYISAFSLTDETDADLEGFEYSGNIHYPIDFPLGVSNAVPVGKTGKITVKTGLLLIITEKK